MHQQSESVYEFGSFRVDSLKRVLLREGEMVPLTSKSLDTLLVLVQNRGQVVSKDDLMKTLWPDTVVEENNLTQQIAMLRKALGERAKEHRYIVTVPGRGYSFVADVIIPKDGESDLIVEQHIRSRITVDVEDHTEKEVSRAPKDVRYLAPVTSWMVGRWTTKSTLLGLSALTVVLVALVAFWFSSHRKQSQKAAQVKKSIAVLPFKLLHSDPSNDYLSAGMADALIARLSNIRQISVRPTSSTIKYSDQTVDAQTVGRDLGVDSVLEGTVQKAGERVRVTVQLVNVDDRNPIWARSFDERFTDIFTLQDSISEQVAQTMMVRLNGDEERQLRKHETESVEAYQEYLRGRYFWNMRNETGLKKSLDHFQQAINFDSGYGRAYAGLADAYILLASHKVNSFPPAESFGKAKELATKALSVDENLAEAHASLGLINARYDRDDVGAETEFKRAIELDPNYATAHHWYSEHLAMTGREEEAMTEIKRAHELDPLSPVISTTLGERLYYARRYDEAATQLRKTLEIAPDFGAAHFALGLTLEQKGMFDEAISELQKAKGTEALNLGAAASLAHVFGRAGQPVKARRILQQLLSDKNAEPYLIALVYQGLADKQQVIGWLGKAKNESELCMLLRLDPRLDGLRSERKFQALL